MPPGLRASRRRARRGADVGTDAEAAPSLPGEAAAGRRDEHDQVVYRFPKNRREEVRATLSTYNGHRLADLRVWARDDAEGAVPTRKGVSVKVEDLPSLLAAVEALVRASEAA